VSIARQFADLVTQKDEAPDLILALLKPELDALREKEQTRKIQRRGSRQPSGNPRGRPRLSLEKAADSKERCRDMHRLWMRAKRARDNGL
jgi:hypothetical protein